MARKKRISFGARLGHVVGDFANAASVAATGSEIGILERAAEEGIGSPAVERPATRRKRKSKAAPGKRKRKAARKKKQVVSRKTGGAKKKKRAAVRRRGR